MIFPKNIIENTVLIHNFRIGKKSNTIYLILILFLLIVMISLPIIRVDIFSNSRGIIKSEKERVVINSINSGKVIKTNIISNKMVAKGDTMLVLDNHNIDSKLELIQFNLSEYNLFKNDLEYLLLYHRPILDSISSAKYQKEYLLYTNKIKGLRIRYNKLHIDFKRNKKLFEKGVIALKDFEQYKFELDLMNSNISELKRQQHSIWQKELSNSLRQIEVLENNFETQLENREHYIITAPIGGSFINVKGIEVGSIIQAGRAIAEISPEGPLIAECYVSPSEIGLLKRNYSVQLQIDSFNYNHWGFATGSIIEIGKDIEFINEVPLFKIRCKIDEKFLTLKNGVQGFISKGMTFRARFKIAERSIFELLYDDINDWLNPGIT